MFLLKNVLLKRATISNMKNKYNSVLFLYSTKLYSNILLKKQLSLKGGIMGL